MLSIHEFWGNIRGLSTRSFRIVAAFGSASRVISPAVDLECRDVSPEAGVVPHRRRAAIETAIRTAGRLMSEEIAFLSIMGQFSSPAKPFGPSHHYHIEWFKRSRHPNFSRIINFSVFRLVANLTCNMERPTITSNTPIHSFNVSVA